MNKEEYYKRKATLKADSDNLRISVGKHRTEEERVIDVLHNSESILNKLNQTFEKRTSLSKIDTSILMLATTLQLIRIYLLPKFQNEIGYEYRLDHNDPKIVEMEKEEMDKFKKSHQNIWDSIKSKKNFRSWQEIAFTRKVPYDATRHSFSSFSINMHGGQHRVKTLGHDPILGWIFGVANIISDSITVCPEYELEEKKVRIPYLKTYQVDMGPNFCWTEKISTIEMFDSCGESIAEDKHRLFAALFAQGLHLTSDKYTKMGLPVPFLSLLDTDKAYGIYKEGYDYLDYLFDTQILRRCIKSASQAMFVNMIIGGLHKLFYNPEKDYNQKIYDIRTKKIILYSNLIATTSDVVQTSIRAYQGDKNALKNIDLGGFLVTIHRLLTDTMYIMKIKEEFIFKEWDRIFESDKNIYNIKK